MARRLRPLLVLSLLAIAITVNLSWVHHWHDADSLLTSLISIDRWTPYYWGDNRFGTLLPLLASPIRSYIPNLIVQTQLFILAAIATVVLFQCFFLERERGPTVRNLCAACLTIGLAMFVFRPTDRVVQAFLLSHPYFISLSLAFVGLIALLRFERRPLLRYSIAAAALLVSFWVNWTNGPVVLGLALLLPAGAPTIAAHLRTRLPAVLLVAAALAVMYSYSLFYPRLVTTGMASASEFLKSASIMLANVGQGMLYPLRIALLAFTAIAVAAIRWRSAFVRKLFSFGEAQVIMAIALVFAISVASTEWVIRNLYEWRYWTVPIALVFLVVASFIADSVFALLHRATASTGITVFLCLLVIGAAVIKGFGLPSVALAQSGIKYVCRADYAKVKRLQCTHMLGDYWVAWSSVFYNRSHGIQPPLWAVSLRSEATEDIWSKIPAQERRYCGICGDTMNNYYQIVFKLGPLRHTDQADNLCLFQP